MPTNTAGKSVEHGVQGVHLATQHGLDAGHVAIVDLSNLLWVYYRGDADFLAKALTNTATIWYQRVA
ncbi:MAG: hypothetical protein ACYCY0_14235 [Acidithiobacillus ferrivorans]